MSDVSYDPIRARQSGYDYQQGLTNQVANLRAGSALGSGDYAGAASALGRAGMIPETIQVQNAVRQQAAAARQISDDERDQQKTWMTQALDGLSRIPAERRAEVYRSTIRPVVAQFGLSPEQLAQLDASDMSDETISAGRLALGGTVPLASANDRAGRNGAVLRPDPMTGAYTEVYTPPVDPMDDLDRRYREAQIAATQASVGQREAAAEKSRRGPAPRGGGGSVPSGRSAGAPSARPWERSW
jgi:hypothetical protein